MDETLPRPVQLKLQQTLNQWQHWRGYQPGDNKPRALQVLAGGLSNYTVRVAGEADYVVRIDNINSAALQLNRATEWHVLQAASAQQLAPQPVYRNPELGVLVSRYITPQPAQNPSITQIAQLLRRIHQLPPIHQRLHLHHSLERYHHQAKAQACIPTAELDELLVKATALVDHTAHQAAEAVLCHHDLLRANRLMTASGLVALDWEYSAMGHPWFDLAVTASEMPDQASALLSAYLEREINTAEKQQFFGMCQLYRYLELLWMYASHQPRSIWQPALQSLHCSYC